ncbi:PspC domain-containing protein [Nakamurella flavida]|uniref:PspC domain-containing protein n=1 Tax=Nakamurella flavida TaxID=363630 RepID=A0A938YMG6_9ACTN|nr:PspC domain-containing protein [Nakamurella flavida]MBM9475924.1 PspC domain-containing protein [Nakamurella flavida]MBM9478416.1 PspC domain-containing protein [Nakamurella flavida]MDP9777790.1 phage shock protein PspC (stress-responsive transcriptional regulator)/predicted membrane protein [Nakamurella flavida]
MNQTPGSPAGPAADSRSAQPAGTWWAQRPRRSATDRKIAGVAGGLGRALGVDPVVIRVAFVVLTVFGGFGGLLYLLGWLLLPGDGDEVSAAESLLGRGQSSVPPVLAVGLGVLLAVSTVSTFSWGTPVPLVVIGVVIVLLARRRSAGCTKHGGRGGTPPWAADLQTQARTWGQQAQDWTARQPWATEQPAPRGPDTTGPGSPRSPFTDPPLWDQADTTRPDDGPPAPPAWDPLGAAPFAWDLPEPGPAPAPAAERRADQGALAAITLGLALLAGAGATIGVYAGWWALSWAAVMAVPLTVVALGLFVGAFRGQGRSLVGTGVFLSIATVGLALTGVTGTDGFGEQRWTPTSVEQLESSYVMNGGQGVLDLRGLTVPAGTDRDVSVTVRAGQAQVLLPAGMNVDGTCHANAGSTDCLEQTRDGLNSTSEFASTPSPDQGTLHLTVEVGTGEAQVRRG